MQGKIFGAAFSTIGRSLSLCFLYLQQDRCNRTRLDVLDLFDERPNESTMF